MYNVEIQKYPETENTQFLAEVQGLLDQIQRRAHALFEERGRVDGGDMEDWFTAEHEVLSSLPADVTEKDGEFHLLMAVPGFDAKEIEIAAMASCIVVKAETSQTEGRNEGESRLSQFAERTLFRRIDLPTPIDVDSVKATLDNGVLLLTAEKTRKPKEKTLSVVA